MKINIVQDPILSNETHLTGPDIKEKEKMKVTR
jgi:hypothetical protein